MDRETRHELDRLLECFALAVDEVRQAGDEEKELAGWHKLRTLGFELNEVLPGLDQQRTV